MSQQSYLNSNNSRGRGAYWGGGGGNSNNKHAAPMMPKGSSFDKITPHLNYCWKDVSSGPCLPPGQQHTTTTSTNCDESINNYTRLVDHPDTKFIFSSSGGGGEITDAIMERENDDATVSASILGGGGLTLSVEAGIQMNAPNNRPPSRIIPWGHIIFTHGARNALDFFRNNHTNKTTIPTTSASSGSSGDGTPATTSDLGFSACAHFYFNGECRRGNQCGFFHVAHIDPFALPGQLAPKPTSVPAKASYLEGKNRNTATAAGSAAGPSGGGGYTTTSPSSYSSGGGQQQQQQPSHPPLFQKPIMQQAQQPHQQLIQMSVPLQGHQPQQMMMMMQQPQQQQFQYQQMPMMVHQQQQPQPQMLFQLAPQQQQQQVSSVSVPPQLPSEAAAVCPDPPGMSATSSTNGMVQLLHANPPATTSGILSASHSGQYTSEMQSSTSSLGSATHNTIASNCSGAVAVAASSLGLVSMGNNRGFGGGTPLNPPQYAVGQPGQLPAAHQQQQQQVVMVQSPTQLWPNQQQAAFQQHPQVVIQQNTQPQQFQQPPLFIPTTASADERGGR